MRIVPRETPTRPTVFARQESSWGGVPEWRWHYFVPLGAGQSVTAGCDSWAEAMGWLCFWVKRQGQP